MASLMESFAELSMPTELAKVVAGAVGGRSELQGTFTLNGATNVVVGNTQLGALDQIIYTLKTVGGTVVTYPVVKVRTNGVGFQVAGSATDLSVYDYRILKAT